MIDVCVWPLLIFHSTVTKNALYSLLRGDSVYQCPDFPPPSFPTLLHAFCVFYSTSLSPHILFAYCSHLLYANPIWLELLPTSIPWPPISSTHLPYLIITTQGKGNRTVSTTKQKITSAQAEKPSTKLSSLSSQLFSSTILFIF